jgi:hypothetical protein
MHARFHSENLKGSDHLPDMGNDGRTIQKLILDIQDVREMNSSDSGFISLGDFSGNGIDLLLGRIK